MALITRVQDALLLQRILQSQSVDDRGQHAHVIGGNTVHGLGLFGYAAEEIAAADHDRDLDAQTMNFSQLRGNFVHTLVLDTKPLVAGQRFTGEFQQNALINRSVHFFSGYQPGWS